MDTAYLPYGWADYFRLRNTQPPTLPANAQLTVPPMQNVDLYNYTNNPMRGFHPPHFTPGANLMPQYTSDFQKSSLGNIHPKSVSPTEQLSLRLSPLSTTQSLSPQQNLIIHDSKINSTIDQSNSDAEDDFEIDVVKSAFHPIKASSLLKQEIQDPDSTITDDSSQTTRTRNEFKAASTKKLSVISQRSPDTKIQTTTTKNVWRPY